MYYNRRYLIVQTIFQNLAGVVIAVPVLVTKVGIFVALALFAAYFDISFFTKI